MDHESLGTALALGAIAGGTIALGLPLGRIKAPMPGARAMLNAVAIGILWFLSWDVLTHAYEPISLAARSGKAGQAAGYGLLAVAGLAIGLGGLSAYEARGARRHAARQAGSMRDAVGAAAEEVATGPGRSAGERLAFLIATGIGLHNFGEGLSIGASASLGATRLALVLVIGFGLHNATEGFGIVAPLAVERAERGAPSIRLLALLGFIGGGPTFLGTWAGYEAASPALAILFLTLAAGSLVYVIIQLLGVAKRLARPQVTAWGIVAGLVLGFATDLVVTLGGA